MFGIMGGSGLQHLVGMKSSRRVALSTPYGDASGPLTIGLMSPTGAIGSMEPVQSVDVVFLPRHGYGHTIAPHRINYRANIWAMKEAGVKQIVAVASVGGIRPDLLPGTLVIPHQLVDYTWGRESTYSGESSPVSHVDFTHPYSEALRARILKAAGECGMNVGNGAVYAVTQGPRLETAGEIDRIERDGGDVVGMTGMPEAALARELDLEYAALAIVVNHAAGRGESRQGIDMTKVTSNLADAMGAVTMILQRMVTS